MVLCNSLLLYIAINGQLVLRFTQLGRSILNEHSTDRVLFLFKLLKFLHKFLWNTLLYWLPNKSIIVNMLVVVKDVGYLKNGS